MEASKAGRVPTGWFCYGYSVEMLQFRWLCFYLWSGWSWIIQEDWVNGWYNCKGFLFCSTIYCDSHWSHPQMDCYGPMKHKQEMIKEVILSDDPSPPACCIPRCSLCPGPHGGLEATMLCNNRQQRRMARHCSLPVLVCSILSARVNLTRFKSSLRAIL